MVEVEVMVVALLVGEEEHWFSRNLAGDDVRLSFFLDFDGLEHLSWLLSWVWKSPWV